MDEQTREIKLKLLLHVEQQDTAGDVYRVEQEDLELHDALDVVAGFLCGLALRKKMSLEEVAHLVTDAWTVVSGALAAEIAREG